MILSSERIKSHSGETNQLPLLCPQSESQGGWLTRWMREPSKTREIPCLSAFLGLIGSTGGGMNLVIDT